MLDSLLIINLSVPKKKKIIIIHIEISCGICTHEVSFPRHFTYTCRHL